MFSIGHPRTTQPGRPRRAEIAWTLGVLAFAAVFMASDIASRPLVLWDESRVAVNGLEMSLKAFSLVTTYGFQPDVWNTKPPLAIWLIAASIRLFGPHEWAVRLPSYLASLATVAVVMRACLKETRSIFVAVVAGLSLVLSSGWFGDHAAMSGDYDALLCFFTTAYLLVLFETIHRRRPPALEVLLAGLLVALACLTKGIAGLMPGIGIAVYLAIRLRLLRPFRTPWYLVAGLVVVVIVGGFYAAREALGAGYLAAVTQNELGARYLRGMNGHAWGPLYYGRMMGEGFAFSWGAFLALPAIALPWRKVKSAALFCYANLVWVCLLIVFSISRTKIFWYIVPAYPFVAIAFAIAAHRLFQLLERWLPTVFGASIGRIKPRHLIATLALVAAALAAFHYRYDVLPPAQNVPMARYGELFADLSGRGYRRIATLDAGVYNNDDLADYTPQRWFYTLVWRGRGLDISQAAPSDAPVPLPGRVLATCDPNRVEAVAALGPAVTSVPGCAAVASGGA